jgi:hypothetical protein
MKIEVTSDTKPSVIDHSRGKYRRGYSVNDDPEVIAAAEVIDGGGRELIEEIEGATSYSEIEVRHPVA